MLIKIGSLIFFIFTGCTVSKLESASSSPAGLPPNDSFQWSKIPVSSDTKTIYLSSSDGNDSNNCLSESMACQTSAHAISLLRNGYPDHLLIRRGDTFNSPLATNWNLSGRSESEPIVIATYGTHINRPYFRTGLVTAFRNDYSVTEKHIWIMDMRFHANERDPNDPSFRTDFETIDRNPPSAIFILTYGQFEDFLVEGCEMSFYGDNFVVEGAYGSGARPKNIRLRANNIHDSWSYIGGRFGFPSYGQGHTQGIFASDVDGLLLEQNIIEHNGGLNNYTNDSRRIVPARLTADEVTGTWFSRQLYSKDNTDVVLKRNIFANGDGVQIRSGGIATDNIFIRCVNSLSGGWTDHVLDPDGYYFKIENNLLMEGTDFSPDSHTAGPRAIGIGISHTRADILSTIKNNLVLRDISSAGYGGAIGISGDVVNSGIPLMVRQVVVSDNVVVNWRGGLGVTGTPGVNVFNTIFENNFVYNPNDTYANLAKMVGAGDAHAVWKNNKYKSGKVAGDWFSNTVSGVTINFATWSAQSGEVGSSIIQTTIRNPNAKFEDQVLGAGASYEAAWVRLRQQTRWNWNSNLETHILINKVRADMN
jgi:hypothetical protein